jgi:hypothetical protein
LIFIFGKKIAIDTELNIAKSRYHRRRMTMDRLARNAMLARQAGMSYGKWKALQPIIPIEPKKVDESHMKTCPYCGVKFYSDKPNRKYCGANCQMQINIERAKLRAKKKKEEEENESKT